MALNSALRKFRAKVKHYDRERTGGARYFTDAVTLEPAEFRQILSSVFMLNFTKEEFVAILGYFDTDGDGAIDNAEFQRAFFRLAFEGREMHRIMAAQAGKRIEARNKKWNESLRKKLTARTAATLAEYSEKDVNSMQDKSQLVARTFKTNSAIVPGLESFEGKLDVTEFRERCKSSLHMNLSAKEFSAFFHACDLDKSGFIEGAEFKYQFLKMRREGNTRANIELHEENERISNLKKTLEETSIKRFITTKDADISYDYTATDLGNVLDLIAKTAAHHDSRFSLELNNFKTRLNPTAFRDQLSTSFGIKMSPKELGALFQHVDRDGNGLVDGDEFLIVFAREGDRWRKMELEREMKIRVNRHSVLNGFVKTKNNTIRHKVDRDRTTHGLPVVTKKKCDPMFLPYLEYRCDDGVLIQGKSSRSRNTDNQRSSHSERRPGTSPAFPSIPRLSDPSLSRDIGLEAMLGLSLRSSEA
eukprot:CAMPEP_0185761320 /NCGR_PEP_ID=MMETSP1174-20130828/20217_1 /TAXON_ID=35687 /ORGANISM="Dictyocha speculum, Strain CCMP1381" /LENGTH=473 /DNA_ID=CAMNT_0028442483 /DNA_START=94 /DNA_END=1515 /DNA_ORIENTATION=-